MSRTFKDAPLWVRENRTPTWIRHRHHHTGECDDPGVFTSNYDMTRPYCQRSSWRMEKDYMQIINESRFYERDRSVRRNLRGVAREWNSTGDCDDSGIPRVGKNASLHRCGWWEI